MSGFRTISDRWASRSAPLAIVALLAASVAVLTASPGAAAAVIHVDRSATTGADDGTSWVDAFVSLEDALAVAGIGDEVRVAEGTYVPSAATAGYVLPEGVSIFGGYAAGGSTSPDPATHPTILSGDQNGDDAGVGVGASDNNETVLGAVPGSDPRTIAGLTIRGGGVDPGSPGYQSSALLITYSHDVTVRDVIVEHNHGTGIRLEYSGAVIEDVTMADNGGAGLFADNSPVLVRRAHITENAYSGIFDHDSRLRLVDSVVEGNEGPNAGGVYIGDFNTLTIVNSIIRNNRAIQPASPSWLYGHGGGITVGESATLLLVNSLVVGNEAADAGGGISTGYNLASTIVNSVVSDNTAPTAGGIHEQPNPGVSTTRIDNSIVWGNTPGPGLVQVPPSPATTSIDHSLLEGWTGGGAGNLDTDPLFIGPGDYRLQTTSAAIDAGNDLLVQADDLDVDEDANTTEPAPALDGSPRIQGTVDMGAYETQTPTGPPTIVPGGVTATEGPTGTQLVQVPVTLSAPDAGTVTAQWRTVDYSATSPGDFVAATGQVTFAPGETASYAEVVVVGDSLHEATEGFALVFEDPTNATIGGFFGLGIVFIDDDDPMPVATPGTHEVTEGNGPLMVPLTLSEASGRDTFVQWTTYDLTASSPGDYAAASGTVTIPAGQLTGHAEITVTDDTDPESTEAFIVSFTDPEGATMGGFWGLGAGFILDND